MKNKNTNKTYSFIAPELFKISSSSKSSENRGNENRVIRERNDLLTV